jgi:hypothetical protein
MALKLVSRNASPRNPADTTFLMSPSQHRAVADALEEQNPELAQQHRNVAKMIEARRARDASAADRGNASAQRSIGTFPASCAVG